MKQQGKKKKSAAATRKTAGTKAKKKVTRKVDPNTQKPITRQTTQNKVFDVAKPGSSMPSSTTRPIIVSHRPMARDPMMSPNRTAPDGSAAEEAKPEGEVSAAHARGK